MGETPLTTPFDVHMVVRETLRAHAFSNTGSLPPTRLDTLALQLGQFLTNDSRSSPKSMGHTLGGQGIGLHSITAVLLALQTRYLHHNNPTEALEIAQKMTAVIEGYFDHQITQVRSEQERFRAAETAAKTRQQ